MPPVATDLPPDNSICGSYSLQHMRTSREGRQNLSSLFPASTLTIHNQGPKLSWQLDTQLQPTALQRAIKKSYANRIFSKYGNYQVNLANALG